MKLRLFSFLPLDDDNVEGTEKGTGEKVVIPKSLISDRAMSLMKIDGIGYCRIRI